MSLTLSIKKLSMTGKYFTTKQTNAYTGVGRYDCMDVQEVGLHRSQSLEHEGEKKRYGFNGC